MDIVRDTHVVLNMECREFQKLKRCSMFIGYISPGDLGQFPNYSLRRMILAALAGGSQQLNGGWIYAQHKNLWNPHATRAFPYIWTPGKDDHGHR